MLLGVLLIAAEVIGFASSQGSFQQAGVEADQATAQIEQSTESAIDQTGAAIDEATTEDTAQNETSETATN